MESRLVFFSFLVTFLNVSISSSLIFFIYFQVGFIGLVEEQWIATLSTINYDEIIYESYVAAGKRLANELKTEHVVNYYLYIYYDDSVS